MKWSGKTVMIWMLRSKNFLDSKMSVDLIVGISLNSHIVHSSINKDKTSYLPTTSNTDTLLILNSQYS